MSDKNPISFDFHSSQLWKVHSKHSSLQCRRNQRRYMHAFFPLTPGIAREWLEDERVGSLGWVLAARSALWDFPAAGTTWSAVLKSLSGLQNPAVSPEQMRKAFRVASVNVGCLPGHGQNISHLHREYLYSTIISEKTSDVWERVLPIIYAQNTDTRTTPAYAHECAALNSVRAAMRAVNESDSDSELPPLSALPGWLFNMRRCRAVVSKAYAIAALGTESALEVLRAVNDVYLREIVRPGAGAGLCMVEYLVWRVAVGAGHSQTSPSEGKSTSHESTSVNSNGLGLPSVLDVVTGFSQAIRCLAFRPPAPKPHAKNPCLSLFEVWHVISGRTRAESMSRGRLLCAIDAAMHAAGLVQVQCKDVTCTASVASINDDHSVPSAKAAPRESKSMSGHTDAGSGAAGSFSLDMSGLHKVKEGRRGGWSVCGASGVCDGTRSGLLNLVLLTVRQWLQPLDIAQRIVRKRTKPKAGNRKKTHKQRAAAAHPRQAARSCLLFRPAFTAAADLGHVEGFVDMLGVNLACLQVCDWEEVSEGVQDMMDDNVEDARLLPEPTQRAVSHARLMSCAATGAVNCDTFNSRDAALRTDQLSSLEDISRLLTTGAYYAGLWVMARSVWEWAVGQAFLQPAVWLQYASFLRVRAKFLTPLRWLWGGEPLDPGVHVYCEQAGRRHLSLPRCLCAERDDSGGSGGADSRKAAPGPSIGPMGPPTRPRSDAAATASLPPVDTPVELLLEDAQCFPYHTALSGTADAVFPVSGDAADILDAYTPLSVHADVLCRAVRACSDNAQLHVLLIREREREGALWTAPQSDPRLTGAWRASLRSLCLSAARTVSDPTGLAEVLCAGVDAMRRACLLGSRLSGRSVSVDAQRGSESNDVFCFTGTAHPSVSEMLVYLKHSWTILNPLMEGKRTRKQQPTGQETGSRLLDVSRGCLQRWSDMSARILGDYDSSHAQRWMTHFRVFPCDLSGWRSFIRCERWGVWSPDAWAQLTKTLHEKAPGLSPARALHREHARRIRSIYKRALGRLASRDPAVIRCAEGLYDDWLQFETEAGDTVVDWDGCQQRVSAFRERQLEGDASNNDSGAKNGGSGKRGVESKGAPEAKTARSRNATSTGGVKATAGRVDGVTANKKQHSHASNQGGQAERSSTESVVRGAGHKRGRDSDPSPHTLSATDSDQQPSESLEPKVKTRTLTGPGEDASSTQQSFGHAESVLSADIKTSSRSQEEVRARTAIVVNLAYRTKSAALTELCQEFRCVAVKIARNDNAVSKGFAFVEFATPDDMTRAVSALDGSVLHGRVLQFSAAQKRAKRVAGSCEPKVVFVKGLPLLPTADVLEAMLRDFFRKCTGGEEGSQGGVAHVRTVREVSGRPRKYAYVEFHSEAAMQQALKLHKHRLGWSSWGRVRDRLYPGHRQRKRQQKMLREAAAANEKKNAGEGTSVDATPTVAMAVDAKDTQKRTTDAPTPPNQAPEGPVEDKYGMSGWVFRPSTLTVVVSKPPTVGTRGFHQRDTLAAPPKEPQRKSILAGFSSRRTRGPGPSRPPRSHRNRRISHPKPRPQPSKNSGNDQTQDSDGAAKDGEGAVAMKDAPSSGQQAHPRTNADFRKLLGL